MSYFLWSSYTPNGFTYRCKVNQKTIELDFVDGGLKLLKPENQSFAIWLPNFFNIMKHASLYPQSSLGVLLDYYNIPVQQILDNFGVQILRKYKDILISVFPNFNKSFFNKLDTFSKNLERDENTWLQAPIINCSWSLNMDYFTSNEIDICLNNGMHTMISILKVQEINNDYVLVFPIINPNLSSLPLPQNLYNKLKSIFDGIKQKFTLPFSLHLAKYKKNS